MDGTVFREVLDALKEEGQANETIAGWAAELDSRMRGRQGRWQRERFPYGSEFAFDTTGQEEVVVWNMVSTTAVQTRILCASPCVEIVPRPTGHT